MTQWDTGVTWHTTLVEGPSEEPLDLAYVRDQQLRVTNGNAEDALIDECIRAAREMCEGYTHRSLMPQTWALTLDRFPSGGVIELPYPPLLSIESVAYVDGADATQTVALADYRLSRPTGARAKRGTIRHVTSWPSTATRSDAVTIIYRAGYEDGSSPATPNVPADLKAGMCVVATELYKQRSLSVHGFGVGQSPAILNIDAFWGRYRVELVVA